MAVTMLASVSAFVPAASPARRQQIVVNADATKMDGISPPIGFFDPLGFSKAVNDEGLAWLRHAELKHGRVAMAAFVGWLTTGGLGLTLPYDLTLSGMKFSDLGTSPLAAWDSIPDDGKWQIIGAIGAIESIAEAQKPHPMRGGVPGKIDFLWDPAGTMDSLSADQLKTKRLSELNNGRLAMIGTMGFVAASTVPGSVPALAVAFKGDYVGGLPFAPFNL